MKEYSSINGGEILSGNDSKKGNNKHNSDEKHDKDYNYTDYKIAGGIIGAAALLGSSGYVYFRR